MPGIFGLLRPRRGDPEMLARDVGAMARTMTHRPTYTSHTWCGERAALGRAGPSFLNPETQPVFNADGSLAIVFEGELLLPDDLVRKELEGDGPSLAGAPDADIVLRTFEKHGSEGIGRLPGAYAGFIYDGRSHVGHLFTDRMGLRGCYYCLAGDGTFLFGSEMKAIAAVPGFRGTVDEQAVSEFLGIGYPFFERTFFREIRYLPYGSVLTVQEGRVELERYWDFPRLDAPGNWKFEDAVHEAAELFGDAMRRQSRRSGRAGCMLSGGLDSRTVVAGAAADGQSLVTFSLGSGENLDQLLASRVAARLGLVNHRLQIPPDFLTQVGALGMYYTDAMFPCSHLHWLSQLDHIERHVQTLYTGHLANIVMDGAYLNRAREAGPVPPSRHGAVIARFVAGRASPFLAPALRPGFGDRVPTLLKQTFDEIARRTGDRGLGSEFQRIMFTCDERRFVGIGHACMLGSVADVKYPFADYSLLDLRARVPDDWRVNSALYKEFFLQAFPQLADIPCISIKTKWVPTILRADNGPIRVPWHRVRWQRMKKLGRYLTGRVSSGRVSLYGPETYVHYAHWYRTVPALRSWMRSALLDRRTLARGYYDPKGIRRLLNMQMTKGYPFDLLAQLVTFEYWNRFFVDGERPSQVPTAETR